MIMQKIYDFMGGRKLLFALILMLIVSVFVWFGKANADQWISFNQWIFGIYAGGNAGEHFANAIKKRK
jgi:nitrate/nitrite transporter NarK